MNKKEKNTILLERLEELAQRLEISVSYEQGIDGQGGYCRLKNEQLILVNKKIPLSEKIGVISDILKTFPLDSIYILPELREYLECQINEEKKKMK